MNHPELDAEKLFQKLEHGLKAALAGAPRLALVGIYSGGAWLAERLAKSLDVSTVGYIDVSFYRDDYAKRGLKEEVRPSQIPLMCSTPVVPPVLRSIRCSITADPEGSCSRRWSIVAGASCQSRPTLSQRPSRCPSNRPLCCKKPRMDDFP